MNVLTILSAICAPQLIYFIPFLIIVGYIAKNYTCFPNKCLPMMEIVLGGIVGVCFGVGTALTNGENIASAVIMYGSQGVVLGFASISVYDTLYNALFKKPQEVIEMKERKERKKFKPFDHQWFVYGISIIASVAMCAMIELIFHGVGSVWPFIRDYAYLCVIPCVAVDVMSKLSKEKAFLTWQYAVQEVLIVATCFIYAMWSVTETWAWFWGCMTAEVLVIAFIILWHCKWYKPAFRAKRNEVVGRVKEELIANGADKQSADICCEYFFAEEE